MNSIIDSLLDDINYDNYNKITTIVQLNQLLSSSRTDDDSMNHFFTIFLPHIKYSLTELSFINCRCRYNDSSLFSPLFRLSSIQKLTLNRVKDLCDITQYFPNSLTELNISSIDEELEFELREAFQQTNFLPHLQCLHEDLDTNCFLSLLLSSTLLMKATNKPRPIKNLLGIKSNWHEITQIPSLSNILSNNYSWPLLESFKVSISGNNNHDNISIIDLTSLFYLLSFSPMISNIYIYSFSSVFNERIMQYLVQMKQLKTLSCYFSNPEELRLFTVDDIRCYLPSSCLSNLNKLSLGGVVISNEDFCCLVLASRNIIKSHISFIDQFNVESLITMATGWRNLENLSLYSNPTTINIVHLLNKFNQHQIINFVNIIPVFNRLSN